MPSTTKERLAKLRENRKKDPEKYAEHLRKERERDAIRRKKKKEELCTEDLKLEQRLRVRDRVRAHRAKKKMNEVVCDSPIGSYTCLQTFSKAVRKVKKSLPDSPLKKAAVVKKVITDVLGGDYEIKASEFFKNKGPRITEEAQQVVKDFFYRDDVSRQAPGMKDCKTVRDPETGVKVKKQKRTMILTIREAYEYFKEINPEIDIGKSSFYNLRPTEVLPIADTPHNVCVCTQHANYINLFKSLKKFLPLPENHKKLMEMISCDITNEACMSGSCDKCPKNFWNSFDTTNLVAKQISWNQWSYINNRPEIITKTTTCEEALNELKNMTDKFRLHCYIKQVQSNHFETTRKNLQKNEAVIQIDFAENYALIHQDEIQSAHWSHKQVTIFTCCIWFDDETKSVAIISNDTSHTKQAVWTFLKNIMDYIQAIRRNSIATFYIFSDNCAAQFKNKYILSSLHELKDRANAKQLQWNFFAASHGKGAVDGIGGTIKRLAWMGVKSRQVIMNSATDFYNFVKKQTQTIHVVYITIEDIERETQFLKDLWDDVQGIPNLQKQHYFEVLDYRRIIVAKTCKFISVQVAVVKQDIWEEEYLQPIATLKKKHDENQDASSVRSDSDPDLGAVPGFSGNLQAVQTVKKRLKDSDVYTDSEEDEPGSVQKIKPGTFVLVRFQLESRKSTEFRYAGICQSLVSDDDGEVQVMFLKVVGDKATTFRPDEEDVYDVRYEDIICVLPTAILKIKGDRTYYEFPVEIDVFEK